jgi:polysaccharide biosynthesis/export protein
MVLRFQSSIGNPWTSLPVTACCLLTMTLLMAGCAKQSAPMRSSGLTQQPGIAAPSEPAPTPQSPTAKADDAPLSGDPIANQPPMPVALLPPAETVAAITLPPTGVGFTGPIGNQVVAFKPSYRSDWTPVLTLTTDDHLAPDIIAVVDEKDPYLLDTGDRVRIFVYGQPNLSRTYAIDVAGTISMPLIGTVQARGVTTQSLKNRVRAALAVKYVRDPEVAIEVSQYRPFFILGEVRTAGQYPWVNDLTVQSAVAIAGGFSPRATERSVRLTRRIDGVISEIDVPTSYSVKPGDTIYVQERFF